MISKRKEKEKEEGHLTYQEKRKKEVEERVTVIENFKTRGRETVEEYIELKKELEELTFEERYAKWFRENKETLERMFDSLFKAFTKEKQKTACFVGKEINGKYFIFYEGKELEEVFLKELLRRYGYATGRWDSYGGSKLGLVVSCRKEYI